jgi:hypothetical protein
MMPAKLVQPVCNAIAHSRRHVGGDGDGKQFDNLPQFVCIQFHGGLR